MIFANPPVSSLFKRSALWAALSLSLLASAHAVTLTRPVIQSKQGEALLAEIDITKLSAKEQVGLQASLASADAYKTSKLELPNNNGNKLDIQIQLLHRANGQPYLKITSQQPVGTGFVDILLEMRWATGRMLHAVNLSLDDSRSAKKSSTTAVSGGATQVVVQRGDTASALAVRHASEGVSLDQMLLAMLRSNPDAFVDANVNRLKSGALVTVPTAQDAKAVSREEAHKEIVVQTANFQAYRAELAARAPGGAAPKASRDSVGKLEAQVQNKKAKTNQDKLTLAKPTPSGAEAKIAQQREALEVASRAAEISRNIAELGKIAAATAKATGSAPIEAELPASAASEPTWLDDLSHHPLAPVGAGGLIGLLVLIGLWRRRVASQTQGDNIQGLPPLNVKFDLDLPSSDMREPHFVPSMSDAPTSAPERTHDDIVHAEAHDPETLETVMDEPVVPKAPPARPTMEIPNISLDLEPPANDHPFKVRMDLAQELWQLGQLHTSRALMEEVVNEAKGEVKAQAQQWLAERS